MAAENQDVTTGATAPMCANGCDFFGSAANKNLCSLCYKEHLMKTAAAAAEKKVVVDAAPVPAEEESDSSAETMEKHEGSSGGAAIAEKKVVDAAPALPAAEKESGSSAETTEKHEGSSGGAAAASVMCLKGCGFYGSAANKNMCSSCYRDFLKNAHAAPAVAEKVEVVAPAEPAAPEISAATSSSAPPPPKAAPSRCEGEGCRKKVGLLGFVCRCGGTFCAVHRQKHACDYDFKTAAREQIAKRNPLVVAPKIDKI